MIDVCLIFIILFLIIIASIYIYRSRKKGHKCVGCSGNCSCSTKSKEMYNEYFDL